MTTYASAFRLENSDDLRRDELCYAKCRCPENLYISSGAVPPALRGLRKWEYDFESQAGRQIGVIRYGDILGGINIPPARNSKYLTVYNSQGDGVTGREDCRSI
jgi:hypothetical protein